MADQRKLDPYYGRQRGPLETDEQYAQRMAELDRRDALWARVTRRDRSIPTAARKEDGRG